MWRVSPVVVAPKLIRFLVVPMVTTLLLMYVSVGIVQTMSDLMTVRKQWWWDGTISTTICDCGEPQTMPHLFSSRLLDGEACTADYMATVTERAKACSGKWEKSVWSTRQKKKLMICGDDPNCTWRPGCSNSCRCHTGRNQADSGYRGLDEEELLLRPYFFSQKPCGNLFS